MVQQFDGAPAEGTRDVQERQYGVPLEDLARKEHHVTDVVPDGHCQDGVDEFGRQPQCSQCVVFIVG